MPAFAPFERRTQLVVTCDRRKVAIFSCSDAGA